MVKESAYLILDVMRRDKFHFHAITKNLEQAREFARRLQGASKASDPRIVEVNPHHNQLGEVDLSDCNPVTRTVGLIDTVHLLVRIPKKTGGEGFKFQVLGLFSSQLRANSWLKKLKEEESTGAHPSYIHDGARSLSLNIDEEIVRSTEIYPAGGLDPFWGGRK